MRGPSWKSQRLMVQIEPTLPTLYVDLYACRDWPRMCRLFCIKMQELTKQYVTGMKEDVGCECAVLTTHG